MEKLYLLSMEDGYGHSFVQKIFSSKESAKRLGEILIEPNSKGVRMYVSYDIMEFTKVEFDNEIQYELE
jgi:hypothetical protein